MVAGPCKAAAAFLLTFARHAVQLRQEPFTRANPIRLSTADMWAQIVARHLGSALLYASALAALHLYDQPQMS